MSLFGRPALTAVLSVATAACIFSDPTGISRDYALITPEATTLEVRFVGHMPNVLVVELELSEPNLVIPDDARIPIIVRSPSGDVEEVLMGPAICEDPKYGTVVCSLVLIGTEPDALETLTTHLRAFHAFIQPSGIVITVIPSGQPSQNQESLGGTTVVAFFPYGTIQEIIATVRGWPEVRSVQPMNLSVGPPNSDAPPVPLKVFGYMLIEDAAVSSGNLFLEAVANDVLQVEYTPPGGPALREEIVFAGS